jgi:hypothetical protein
MACSKPFVGTFRFRVHVKIALFICLYTFNSWTDFHEIWYWEFYKKLLSHFHFYLKSANNNGHFMWRLAFISALWLHHGFIMAIVTRIWSLRWPGNVPGSGLAASLVGRELGLLSHATLSCVENTSRPWLLSHQSSCAIPVFEMFCIWSQP